MEREDEIKIVVERRGICCFGFGVRRWRGEGRDISCIGCWALFLRREGREDL